MSTKITLNVREIIIDKDKGTRERGVYYPAPFREIIILAGGTSNHLRSEDVRNEKDNDGDTMKNPTAKGGAAPGTIRTEDDGTTTNITDIQGIKLLIPSVNAHYDSTGSLINVESVAETLTRYVEWKDKVKEKEKMGNDWDITIKNLSYSDEAAAGAAPSNKLKVVTQDVGGVNYQLLVINGTNGEGCSFVGDGLNSYRRIQELIEINSVNNAKKFNDNDYFSLDFASSTSGVNEKEIFWNAEKELDEVNYNFQLGKITRENVNWVNAYYAPGTTTINYDADHTTEITQENAKKLLYLSEFNQSGEAWGTKHRKYRELIRKWKFKNLKEMVVWREHGGFEEATMDNILKANANGFRISARDKTNIASTVGVTIGSGDMKEDSANLTDNISKAIKTGKYKGFPLFEESQIVNDSDGANIRGTTHTFPTAKYLIMNKRAAEPSTWLNKENIDVFRQIPRFDGKTDIRDCDGFQPGDFQNADLDKQFTGDATSQLDENTNKATVANYVTGRGKSYEMKYDILKDDKLLFSLDGTEANSFFNNQEATKICYEILYAENIDDAINVAFQDNKFKEAQRGGKLKLLEKCYGAIKSHSVNDGDGWDITGVTSGPVTYQDLQASAEKNSNDLTGEDMIKIVEKEKIDDAYNLIKEFMTDVDFDKKTTDPTELRKIQNKLKVWKTRQDKRGEWFRNNTMLGKDYKLNNNIKKLAEKIIKEEEKGPGGPTGNKPDDAKIDAARDEVVNAATGDNDFKELLKKIFEDNRAELKKEDEAVLENLKELAKLIDKAYKNGNEVKKSQLEVYSKSTDNNQKKAWELANKIMDKDNKKLGATALNKANKPEKDKKTLEEAKNEAKTALDDAAYKAIIEGNNELNTPELVEKVVEIFKECKKAWQTANGTDDNLKTKLEGFKTNNDKEWKAINKYQFDNSGNACPAGYASGALAKLTKAKLSLDQLIKQSKLTEVTDQASFDAAVQLIKNAPNFNDIKDDYENLLGPRGELLVALSKDSDDDKKAAYKLIAEFMNKFEKNYSDSDYATELTKLEGKLEELKKYQGKKFYQDLDSKHKGTFDTLVTNLENKIKLMKEAQKKAQGNNQQTPNQEGGWKTWYTVALVAGLLLILAGVAYYFLGSKNEEETEE